MRKGNSPSCLCSLRCFCSSVTTKFIMFFCIWIGSFVGCLVCWLYICQCIIIHCAFIRIHNTQTFAFKSRLHLPFAIRHPPYEQKSYNSTNLRLFRCRIQMPRLTMICMQYDFKIGLFLASSFRI